MNLRLPAAILLVCACAFSAHAQDGAIFKIDNKAGTEVVKPVEAAKAGGAKAVDAPLPKSYEAVRDFMVGTWVVDFGNYTIQHFVFYKNGILAGNIESPSQPTVRYLVDANGDIKCGEGDWAMTIHPLTKNACEIFFAAGLGGKHFALTRVSEQTDDRVLNGRPGAHVEHKRHLVGRVGETPASAPLPAAKALDPKLQSKLDEVDADIAKADKTPDEALKLARIANLNSKLRIRESAVSHVASKMRTATQAGDLELALVLKEKKAGLEAEVERLKGEVEAIKNGGEAKKPEPSAKVATIIGKWAGDGVTETFLPGGRFLSAGRDPGHWKQMNDNSVVVEFKENGNATVCTIQVNGDSYSFHWKVIRPDGSSAEGDSSRKRVK